MVGYMIVFKKMIHVRNSVGRPRIVGIEILMNRPIKYETSAKIIRVQIFPRTRN